MTVGRPPVQNFVIETISDINDPRLTRFREAIFKEDLGLPIEDMDLIKDHTSGEDPWKYCNKRWTTVGFDAIEAIIEDDEIVGMSGCRLYGDYLRTSMSLYLLKRVRKKYPGIKYLKGGWFERHINFAKEHNCNGLFFTVYAYSKKLQMLINNHKKRTISLVDKKHLMYMDDIVEAGEYKFNNVQQTFFYYPIKKDLNEFKETIIKKNILKETFLADDILPLGTFETLPVNAKLGGKPDGYPNVTFIKKVFHDDLLDEALKHIEIIGDNYVRPRIEHLSVSEEDLRDTLTGVGFYKGSYQSYSLRKIGSSELEDWVLPSTLKFFDDLPVNTFRQQYAVAYPKWNTQLHRDHKDFLTHGFRAMVPLSADVYMGYEDDNGNPIIYRLERGGMYFVNIAKMHRGFNNSENEDRINLIMQMDSDDLVINSKEMEPLGTEELMDLPHYAIDYSIWEFGYEL